MRGPLHYIAKKVDWDIDGELANVSPQEINATRKLLAVIAGISGILSAYGVYRVVDPSITVTSITKNVTAEVIVDTMNVVDRLPGLATLAIGGSLGVEVIQMRRQLDDPPMSPPTETIE